MFYQKLMTEAHDGDCEFYFLAKNKSVGDSSVSLDEAFFSFAKTLSPAAIDLELRSLVTLQSLQIFLNALKRRLLSRRDFEAVQAFQNVFLRMHGDVIVKNRELQGGLAELLAVQRKESQRVLELIASSLGTLGFVRAEL